MENFALLPSTSLIVYSPHLGSTNRRYLVCHPSTIRREERRKPRILVSLLEDKVGNDVSQRVTKNVREKLFVEAFGSISSSNSRETSSVSVGPQIPVSPPRAYFGTPLFWIGIGVGLSALFSWVATNLKKYAMQQAFKTMMGQMGSANSQFNNPFSPGSPFPYPMPSAPSSTTSSSSTVSSRPAITVDVPATTVESLPKKEEAPSASPDIEKKMESKRYSFVDISPEEVSHGSFENSKETVEGSATKDAKAAKEVVSDGSVDVENGRTTKDASQSSRKSGSILSVEALEKMMEDPTVQKMVYPYLPEEMRNPASFKWMLQNPLYRQQLEDMLNNMGGSNEWDNKMIDSLKNFDLNNPEVKQQFDQIGLTPEEVISKIMANPEVAMAFQNPRVQAAIMDCSQNPLSIAKYQNDKEVMTVFNKISELFPGMTGP